MASEGKNPRVRQAPCLAAAFGAMAKAHWRNILTFFKGKKKKKRKKFKGRKKREYKKILKTKQNKPHNYNKNLQSPLVQQLNILSSVTLQGSQ